MSGFCARAILSYLYKIDISISLSLSSHVFEYFHILLCITVWLGSLAIPRQKIKIGILEIPPTTPGLRSPGFQTFLL